MALKIHPALIRDKRLTKECRRDSLQDVPLTTGAYLQACENVCMLTRQKQRHRSRKQATEWLELKGMTDEWKHKIHAGQFLELSSASGITYPQLKSSPRWLAQEFPLKSSKNFVRFNNDTKKKKASQVQHDTTKLIYMTSFQYAPKKKEGEKTCLHTKWTATASAPHEVTQGSATFPKALFTPWLPKEESYRLANCSSTWTL